MALIQAAEQLTAERSGRPRAEVPMRMLLDHGGLGIGWNEWSAYLTWYEAQQ